jgi:thioredoxin reductase (NADPH)
MNSGNHYDVIIIGAGPAGLTAGIYLSRARLRTLIIDQGTIGGQLVLTHEIANYPGVESVSGYQLAGIMSKQAKTFGCKILGNTSIAQLDLKGDIKSIVADNGEAFTSLAVILSPGGRPRNLGVKGEDKFKGQGISYCATCDGDFFTGKEIIVVGGGNSALEEAVSLTKYASKVTIIHQFDHFQAFEYAIDEAKANPKIDMIMESAISEFYGDERLQGVVIQNIRSGNRTTMEVDGVFIFIGYLANTEMLEGIVELNSHKEIVVNEDLATSEPGVYAAGDSIAKKYRQVTTAVSDGTIAALTVSNYLRDLRKKEQTQLIK